MHLPAGSVQGVAQWAAKGAVEHVLLQSLYRQHGLLMPPFLAFHRQLCDALKGCFKPLAKNPRCCHSELVLFPAFGYFSSIIPAFLFTHCVDEANKVNFLQLGLEILNKKKNGFTNKRKTYFQQLLVNLNYGFASKKYLLVLEYILRETLSALEMCYKSTLEIHALFRA